MESQSFTSRTPIARCAVRHRADGVSKERGYEERVGHPSVCSFRPLVASVRAHSSIDASRSRAFGWTYLHDASRVVASRMRLGMKRRVSARGVFAFGTPVGFQTREC